MDINPIVRLAIKRAYIELETSKVTTMHAEINKVVIEICFLPNLSALGGRISAKPAHPAK